MLQVSKLMLAFVEDVVENEPRLVRNSLRQQLQPMCVRQTHEALRAFSDLEGDIMSGDAYPFTGDMLRFCRFLKKLRIAPLVPQHQALRNFAAKQEELSVRSQDRFGKELEFVSKIVHRLCGHISYRAEGRHGPGTTSERIRGLEKSLVGVDLRDAQLDPLFRLHHTWCNTPKRTRILAVPKDWRRDRIIGAEPTWTMFKQKALCADLMSATELFVPYHDQERHISMLKDDSLTIDLSDASDNLTVDTVQLLFPADLFLRAWDIRTDTYTIGSEIGRTNSFALMGNGFCFPFLSITCLSLAIGSFLMSRGEWTVPSRRELLALCKTYGISAFGDDIIIPSMAYPYLQTLLAQAGLVLNREKSAFPSVQETCGVWIFRGRTWKNQVFRQRITCPYLKSTKVTGEDGLANCSLQRELYRLGLRHAACELGKQLRRLNCDVVAVPSTAIGGDGFYVYDDDLVTCKRAYRKRFQHRGYWVKTLVDETREVVLADGSAVFWAFHGGIPSVEPVSRKVPGRVFLQDTSLSLSVPE